MTWLLLALIILWVLTGVFLHLTDRPGDDFGAVFPALLCGVIATGVTVVYVTLVFWNHRFL